MKVEYKGLEIEVKKEMSLGGEVLAYYSVFSLEGLELKSGFSYDDSPVNEQIAEWKDWADRMLHEPHDYIEPSDIACLVDERILPEKYKNCNCSDCEYYRIRYES